MKIQALILPFAALAWQIGDQEKVHLELPNDGLVICRLD